MSDAGASSSTLGSATGAADAGGAAGLRSTLDVAITAADALLETDAPRIITLAEPPFKVVHVSRAWLQLTELKADDLVGKTCRVQQGEGTCQQTLDYLREAVLARQSCAVRLLNYTKSGRPFMNTLHVRPLVDPSGSVHLYVGELQAAFVEDEAPARVLSLAALPAGILQSSVREADTLAARRNVNPRAAAEETSIRAAPFLMKLIEIVKSCDEELLLYEPRTRAFVVRDPAAFASDVRMRLGSQPALHAYASPPARPELRSACTRAHKPRCRPLVSQRTCTRPHKNHVRCG